MVKYFWLIWLLPVVAFSQEKVTFSFDNKPISEVLFSLEKTFDVRFSYSDKLVENKKITINRKQKILQEILEEIESKTTLEFKRINKRYLIVKNKKELNSLQKLKEIVLDNYLTKGISKNKKGFYTIKPKQLEILPGLIETDVLESIQQLPGVVSVNETATGLVVRGGTSDQNRIIWDGINIYHNGHLFGMISAFNPTVSHKITFHNKGTNPRFGERISSVIDIKTNGQITDKLKASFSINGISADAFIETPIIAKKLSLQLSVRRSYADIYQTTTFDKLSDKVFQTTKIKHTENTTNEFYFTDYNIKLNYKLNKKNSLSFSSIFINNQLDYLVKDIDNAIDNNDLLKIKNEGYVIDWNKKWTDKVSQKTAASFSKYKLNYNFIKTKIDGIGRNQISDFDKRNIIFDTNIFTEFKIETTNKSHINLGYQYSFKDVSYAFLDTSNLSFVLDFDENEITTHSLYTNYSYKNKKIINLETGFRLNYYKELDKIKLEPRLIIYKNLTDKLKLQITGEIKNQVISQIDETVLSNLSLENRLWRLADGKIFPIINSNQISVGILYNSNGWSFDVDHYYKNIKGVTALSLGFLNPDGKTFRIGKQKVVGVDFYTKKDIKNFKTWVSYSYTNVKSKFTDLNKDAYFTANTSITHAVSTSIAYKLKQFQIALGWKWRTGKPFTKSIVSNNQINFEGINTERLPNYHRLDFSTTYQLNLSKKNNLKGKIGLSIRNIYNQKNQLSREYTGFNNLNDPIEVADKFSLGFTPNFLFKVYW